MTGIEYLKPSEAAERLRVNKQTIYRWIKDGQLPAVRLGGNLLRIPVQSVSDMLIRDSTDASL